MRARPAPCGAQVSVRPQSASRLGARSHIVPRPNQQPGLGCRLIPTPSIVHPTSHRSPAPSLESSEFRPCCGRSLTKGGAMRARLPRLTYANVSATLALFVALGGTGYAATTITTSQIANNAVTTPKIKNAAVNSSKLANNAVTSARIASNAVSSAKLPSNAVTSAKIASNAVSTAKIANAAVTTPKIANGAVTAAQIAPAP